MSPIRSTTLLLLSALVALTIAAGQDCPAIGDTNRDAINYALTVSPSDLSNGTVYTVTLTSRIPVSGSVLFEVLSDSTNNGTWSSLPSGFQNCTGAIYGNYTSSNGSSITANWTSPTALTSTSVQFRALLNDQSGQFKVDKSVSVAATSTANPITSSSTGTTPVANSTATTASVTTVSMAPSSTVSATTVSMAPSSTASVATTSMAPSSTADVTTVSMAPSSTADVTTVSMAPSITDNAATISGNGGHATHQGPMFFTLMETLIFLSVTGKLLL